MPTDGGPTFRKYDPKQTLLLPPNLDEWLPRDHLARIVAQVVDEHLDLAPLLASYHNESDGFPAFDPRLQLKALLYGYCIGVASSRRMEKATYEDVAFRYLAANQHPDHNTIARFRERNLDVLEGLFLQGLKIAERLGLVKLGRVAIDGTKVRAHASKHTYPPSARGWYATSYPHAAAPGSALTYQRQFAHDEIRDRRLSTTFPNQGLAAVFNSAVFGPELGRSGV